MTLYEDIERIIGTIKHVGIEAVDPDDLRVTLRHAQTLYEVILRHEALSVTRELGGPWECHILTYLDNDTKKSLFDLLSD